MVGNSGIPGFSPAVSSGVAPRAGGGAGATPPTNPLRPAQGDVAPPALPPNVVGPQATRASGPSAGYDPSYLQNLSTFIGSLFAKPAGAGNVTSFNPLGNLNEVSPPSGQTGNAAGFGAPLTWLQQALNGGGFSFGAPASTATPARPIREPVGRGGGRNPRSPILE